MAVQLTLSRPFLAKALMAKTTPLYANASKYGTYSYDKDIYPQARIAFPEYNKLYPTNEEFTKYFVKDLNLKDPGLLQKISRGSVNLDTQILTEGAAVAQADQITGESPLTMTQGAHQFPSITPSPGISPVSRTPMPKEPEGAVTRKANRLRATANPSAFKTLGSKAAAAAGGIIGPGLTNTASFLGRAGLRGANFGASFLSQLSVRTSSLTASGASKKLALSLLGAFLLFFIGAGLIGGLPGTAPTGEASPIGTNPTGAGCPDTSTNRNDSTCHYLNPSIDIFDTSVSQSSIDSYISKYSSVFINSGKGDLAEFTKRVNYIVTNSQQAGLNPAIFLGYWKTESNFSAVSSRDLGCAGDNFYEQVDCALGINTFSDPAKNPIANCVRSRDAASVACTSLKAVRQTFDTTHPVKYPIATFDDFAESYGPYNHLSSGLHTNCTHTYNELINVAKELSACTPPSTGPVSDGMTKLVNLAGQLTQILKKGTNNLFHIKPDEPSVYYWCTYLIVDSYNIAGFGGLSRSAHAAVLSMKAFFANTSGYKLLPPQTPVGQLRAGDVIFFEGSNDQHVSLIKLFDLDPNGNGVIKTYDANNVFTEDSVDVKNFQAISARTTSHKFAITGFGQITQ